VPIDYSDHSQQALEWGADLAAKYGAKVLLLHVIPKAVEEVHPKGSGWEGIPASFYEGMAPGRLPFRSQPIVIDLVERAQAELSNFATQCLKEPVPLLIEVAVGNPAAEILRVGREEHVDLIAMGTHGRSGLQHLLLGSVAEDVTHHAPCPVITVRIEH
jgi:nucleotide-binding universal stress UspA family protein